MSDEQKNNNNDDKTGEDLLICEVNAADGMFDRRKRNPVYMARGRVGLILDRTSKATVKRF